MAYKQEFADAVRDALGKMSYRQVAARANISASYVADMVQGKIPRREVVVNFAQATGADTNALLAAAGYEPLPSGPTPPDLKAEFRRRLMELALELGQSRVPVFSEEKLTALRSPADVDRLLKKTAAALVDPEHADLTQADTGEEFQRRYREDGSYRVEPALERVNPKAALEAGLLRLVREYQWGDREEVQGIVNNARPNIPFDRVSYVLLRVQDAMEDWHRQPKDPESLFEPAELRPPLTKLVSQAEVRVITESAQYEANARREDICSRWEDLITLYFEQYSEYAQWCIAKGYPLMGPDPSNNMDALLEDGPGDWMDSEVEGWVADEIASKREQSIRQAKVRDLEKLKVKQPSSPK